MSGKYRKQGGDEPPSKKARTDPEFDDDDDGLWDDSMEFTQADLDDIELQASQAITHVQHEPAAAVPPNPVSSRPSFTHHQQPSTSGRISQQKDSSGKFLKPQLSRSSSSNISSHNGSHSANSSVRSNTTSNSVSSNPSSYPGSISGYSSNTSSVSIKSGSSAEIRGQTGSLSRGLSSDSFDMSGLMQSNQSNMSEISKYKQELASIQLQFDKMKEENVVKEGEIQLLRDNLKQRETELDSLKTEKISHINQQNIQQSDREKTLQAELTRLQTQIQFKDEEQRDLSSKYREMEAQLRNLKATPSTSQAVIQSQSVSPKPRKVPVEDRSPKHRKLISEERSLPGQTGFPSKKTFMSAEVSPGKQPVSGVTRVKVTEGSVKVTEEKVTEGNVKVTSSGDNQSSTSVSKCSRLRRDRRSQCLQLNVCHKETRSGPNLVARMIDVRPSMSDNVSERGIVGLLNTPSVSASVYNVQFDRDRDTSLLSPVRSDRLQEFQSLVNQVDRPEMLSLVPTDHYNMAIHGLTQLLRAGNQTTSTFNQADPQTSTSNEQCSHVTDLGEHVLDNAILILPLIDDYLKHYIDMLDSAMDTTTSSSVTTNTSSSSDSFQTPSESPTGSVGLFLKSTASFANDLESLCIAALWTLHELVSCPGVRAALLQTDHRETTEMTGVEEDSNSDSSVGINKTRKFCPIPHKYISNLYLLHKILKLSNPGTKGRLYSAKVVIQCLRILTLLTTHADTQQMNSLVPVLTDECLQNCIEQECEPVIAVHSLALFKALVKSNHVVSSLCSNSTGCVLSSIYGLFSSSRWLSLPECIQLSMSKLTIDSLLYLASCHKGSFTILLESDCQCSVEVVKCIVCLLHTIMKIYTYHTKRHTKDEEVKPPSLDIPEHIVPHVEDILLTSQDATISTSLHVLQTGLQLLQLVLLHDSGFSNRHVPVQHKYVQLVCGLTHIFRPMDNNETEMNALQDLWDFNQDDSELSQDSESEAEVSMDQT